jgi:hypothetical protein
LLAAPDFEIMLGTTHAVMHGVRLNPTALMWLYRKKKSLPVPTNHQKPAGGCQKQNQYMYSEMATYAHKCPRKMVSKNTLYMYMYSTLYTYM